MSAQPGGGRAPRGSGAADEWLLPGGRGGGSAAAGRPRRAARVPPPEPRDEWSQLQQQQQQQDEWDRIPGRGRAADGRQKVCDEWARGCAPAQKTRAAGRGRGVPPPPQQVPPQPQRELHAECALPPQPQPEQQQQQQQQQRQQRSLPRPREECAPPPQQQQPPPERQQPPPEPEPEPERQRGAEGPPQRQQRGRPQPEQRRRQGGTPPRGGAARGVLAVRLPGGGAGRGRACSGCGATRNLRRDEDEGELYCRRCWQEWEGEGDDGYDFTVGRPRCRGPRHGAAEAPPPPQPQPDAPEAAAAAPEAPPPETEEDPVGAAASAGETPEQAAASGFGPRCVLRISAQGRPVREPSRSALLEPAPVSKHETQSSSSSEEALADSAAPLPQPEPSPSGEAPAGSPAPRPAPAEALPAAVAAEWKVFEEAEEAGELDGLQEGQREEIGALAAIFDSKDLRLRTDEGGGVVLRMPKIDVEPYSNATVSITLRLPAAYPAAPPVIELHSATVAKEALDDVAAEATEEAAACDSACYELIRAAESRLQELPAWSVSDAFVFCGACNVRLLRKKRAKAPQPADPDTGACLVCGERNTLRLRGCVRSEPGDECSFCMCEESPLILIGGCGQRVCTQCLQRWLDIDIGARRLKRDAASGHWTLACPTHPDSLLTELPLLKLATPQAYNRYNRFAFERGAERAGCVVCPLPGCLNYPFLPARGGSLVHCPCCMKFFCTVCNEHARDCRCESLCKPRPLPPPFPANTLRNAGLRVELATGTNGEMRPAEQCKAGGTELLLRVVYTTTAVTVAVPSELTVEGLLHVIRQCIPREPRWFANKHEKDQWAAQEASDSIPATALLPFWCGLPLDSPRQKLSEIGVHSGSVLYVALQHPHTEAAEEALLDEIDLWEFRKGLQTGGGDDADPLDQGTGRNAWMGKKCSKCKRPVVHYYNHGCHHIGFAGEGCCDHHWCFACGGPHPCKTCPMFCDRQRKCGCPLCPDCKPGVPCPSCTGCPRCKEDYVVAEGHFFLMF